MNLRNMSNLSQRLIVGTASTFIMFLSIFLSWEKTTRPFFVLLIAGIIGCALYEFYAIAINKKYYPLRSCSIGCSALYVLATFLSTQSPLFHALPLFVLYFTLIIVFAFFFVQGEHPLPTIAITLFGLAYITLPLSFMISINYFFPENSTQDGRLWLSYLLIVTKMTDTGAYIAGKIFGKNKITPYISPSKTFEGAIGGFLATTATSVLFCIITGAFFPKPLDLSLSQSLFLGMLIATIAQFGDLAESLLKRDGHVKDSNQLPGLGGVLDMFDSLIFTAPLVYFFLISTHIR
ncbi:MAG: phosphatidate cytidylyltransferase [Parachlamydiaceae bacterium]|nr:phosphatidate cytidylyltransferase [Parachlamydiaceae bacterium]